MKSFAVASAIAILAMGAASIACAGDHDPGVNARQHNQQARIHQGVRSGELTPHETRKLEREERGIRREERQYKADGQLTAAERRDLQKDLNHASRDVYRQKHDGQERK
ncbi:MAG TPA: hypothetical protein VFS47_15070 [Steroidobacteraceae bacterium]|nr:hypothetical protein [Steroidobacteraceae bacterium]